MPSIAEESSNARSSGIALLVWPQHGNIFGAVHYKSGVPEMHSNGYNTKYHGLDADDLARHLSHW